MNERIALVENLLNTGKGANHNPISNSHCTGSAKNYIMMNINLLGTRDQANKISKHLNTNNADLRAQAVVLEEGGNAVISCEVMILLRLRIANHI